MSTMVKDVTRLPVLLISDPGDGVTFSKKPTVGWTSMIHVTRSSGVSGSVMVRCSDVSFADPPSITTSCLIFVTLGGWLSTGRIIVTTSTAIK